MSRIVLDKKFIAQDAVVRGSCVKAVGTTSSTGYYLDYIGTRGTNDATWEFTVNEAKYVTVYVNALSGDIRYLDIYIDDVQIADNFSMKSSGGWSGNPKIFEIGTFSLSKGSHILEVSKDTGTYAPLVDYVRLVVEADDRFYLIESNSEYYTINGNSIVKLDETELTPELFKTYGFYDLSSNTDLLLSIENSSILTVSQLDEEVSLVIGGIPEDRHMIIEDINLVGPNSNGIKSISYIGSDDILLQVSFDKQTWYKYEIGFIEITDEFEGTELSVVKEIPESVWGSFCGDHTVAYLKLVFNSLSQYLTSISISI